MLPLDGYSLLASLGFSVCLSYFGKFLLTSQILHQASLSSLETSGLPEGTDGPTVHVIFYPLHSFKLRHQGSGKDLFSMAQVLSAGARPTSDA
jgi:hypothetical protein